MHRIEINTQEKLCTRLVLFTRLYKDARSTKHKKEAIKCQVLSCIAMKCQVLSCIAIKCQVLPCIAMKCTCCSA